MGGLSDVDLEKQPLVGDRLPDVVAMKNTFWWRFVHWSGFFTGALTFVVGVTMCFHKNPQQMQYSATLWTVGGLGFLLVDVMEFFTFTSDFLVRLNITCSIIGDTLYVIGSLGFFPQIYDISDVFGIWGFILGSIFIGCSQLWKTFRIGCGQNGTFRFSNLFAGTDTVNQVATELNLSIGAWCVFVGSIMYRIGPVKGPFHTEILIIWEAGSLFFLAGAFSLGYRYWIMGV